MDFAGQVEAIERASQLLLAIVGGKAGPIVEIVSEPDMPERPDVTLRAAQIKRILGFELPAVSA